MQKSDSITSKTKKENTKERGSATMGLNNLLICVLIWFVYYLLRDFISIKIFEQPRTLIDLIFLCLFLFVWVVFSFELRRK